MALPRSVPVYRIQIVTLLMKNVAQQLSVMMKVATQLVGVFRDEQFADDVDDSSGSSSSSGSGSDRRLFDEILAGYRLILTGKRVDPVDIRVKTGWWADSAGTATSSCGSAGKVSRLMTMSMKQESTASLITCLVPNSTTRTPATDML